MTCPGGCCEITESTEALFAELNDRMIHLALDIYVRPFWMSRRRYAGRITRIVNVARVGVINYVMEMQPTTPATHVANLSDEELSSILSGV